MAKSRAEKKEKGRAAKEAARKAKQREQLTSRILWIGIPLLAVAGLIAFGIIRQNNQPPFDPLVGLRETNSQGNVAAPVTIVEFGDFGCPACRQWHRSGIKEQVQREFGDEVRFVFRHFPVITAQSPQAAAASQCAADQGEFWQYHDYLYENANGLAIDQLKGYAADIGLDTAQFNSCVDSGQHEDYVSADLELARRSGARGTPTFMVNGQIVANPTFATLVNVIREVE